jgi:cysteine-rich repeat protein
LCVSQEQTAACGTHVDGDVCVAGGFTGICDHGYCVPGCGDGVISGEEQCDDGNFRSHDGCSSACVTETAGWQQWRSPWGGSFGGGAAFDTTMRRLVLFGGIGKSGFVGDTWLRDGITNTWNEGGTGPSPRAFAAMAYDSTRNVTVLFGGVDASGALIGDTWEYSTGTWAKRSPATSPPARTQAAMAFDASTGHMVLFGGTTPDGAANNDTWEYDGTTWTQLAQTTPPSVRFSSSIAYDSARGRIVLFGGASPGVGVFNDTFELVSGQWVATAPATSPAPRFGATLAFSTSRGKLVLFGGTTTSYASDTWEYDASGWTRVAITNAPPARNFHVLAQDPVANTLVLAGGIGWSSDGATDVFADVWEYSSDPVTCVFVGAPCWVPRVPPFSPSQRATSLAYDGHGLTTLFSGDGSLDIYGDAVADTWTFDGTSWRFLDAPGPQPRRNHSLARDSGLDRVVIFGGECGTVTGLDCNDTWAWDGTTWTAITGPGPAARHGAPMADDPDDGIAVLFGGRSNASGVLADTWELGASGWTPNMATPHPPQQDAQMGYEASGHRLVLYTATAETWTYANHAWKQLQPAHTPGMRSGPLMSYDRARGHVVLFGGGIAGAFDTGLWELGKDGSGDDDWMPVVVSGDPPPVRVGGGLAYDDLLHTLVLFGGTGGASFVSDTWLFRYRSSTPDEICGNGIDDDGDKQVDAADPDCQ